MAAPGSPSGAPTWASTCRTCRTRSEWLECPVLWTPRSTRCPAGEWAAPGGAGDTPWAPWLAFRLSAIHLRLVCAPLSPLPLALVTASQGWGCCAGLGLVHEPAVSWPAAQSLPRADRQLCFPAQPRCASGFPSDRARSCGSWCCAPGLTFPPSGTSRPSTAPGGLLSGQVDL